MLVLWRVYHLKRIDGDRHFPCMSWFFMAPYTSPPILGVVRYRFFHHGLDGRGDLVNKKIPIILKHFLPSYPNTEELFLIVFLSNIVLGKQRDFSSWLKRKKKRDDRNFHPTRLGVKFTEK